MTEGERKAAIDALQEVADQIEAELICCDVWERREYKTSHSICYWGGASRELVLSKILRLETDA